MFTASTFTSGTSLSFAALGPYFSTSYITSGLSMNVQYTTLTYAYTLPTSQSVSVPMVGQLWPRGNRSNL